MPSRYDVGIDALGALLDDQPAYRVRQVWDGLYQRLLEPEQMTDLPKALRGWLTHALPSALEPVTERVSDGGETVKFLWRLHDDRTIETVLMAYRDRVTVCVSSQAGCAMGCGFCATGQAGFERHLATGEIVEQVVRGVRRRGDGGRRVSNIVFMGMGEPLANYDSTWPAVERIHDDVGLSARHLTLSTIGIVPGIRRLAGERLPVNLAVSLHAANDELRDELVPINKRYPLTALSAVLPRVPRRQRPPVVVRVGAHRRRERPSPRRRRLAAYARPLRAHVNLIPLNPTPGWPTRGTPAAGVRTFRDRLIELGINVTIRRTRGTDIDAACGQLRETHLTLSGRER